MPESNKTNNKVYKTVPKGLKVMTDAEYQQWYNNLTPAQRAHYFPKKR